MGKIFELREYVLNFYAKYSRYINKVLQFILALLTFLFISNYIGFQQALASPLVTGAMAIVCTFLPVMMTVVIASIIVLLHMATLAPGAAVVFAIVLVLMYAFYFRFSPKKSMILLVTPLAFVAKMPVLVPVVFGLISTPTCIIPMSFGAIIYFMIAYVKSYAAVVGTMAEAGFMSQINIFAKQLFSNKEAWIMVIALAICMLLVYNLRRLSADHAWEIAIVAGALVYIILIAFGHVIFDIPVSYVSLILGGAGTILIAGIVKLLVFSVDYTRTEYLQFEDDEYYYYVKAVPKVSVAVPEKTVKKINIRQEVGEEQLTETEKELQKERVRKVEQEESEIQKIIEEELKN